MIVTCPRCSTRYMVPDSSLTGKGRTVRCARCGNQWYHEVVDPHARTPRGGAAAAAAEPEVAAESEPDTAASAQHGDAEAAPEPVAAEKTETVTVAPPEGAPKTDDDAEQAVAEDGAPAQPEEPEEDPWERRRRRAADAELPASMAKAPTMPDTAATGGGRGRLIAAWLVFLLLVAGSLAVAHFGREEIVAALPEAKPYYEMLGYHFETELDGLEVIDVTSSRSIQGGDTVLVIEGKVRSSASVAKKIPRLRASLLDRQQSVLQEWEFSVDMGVLAPNSTAPFREQAINPDPNATDVRVELVGAKPTVIDVHEAGAHEATGESHEPAAHGQPDVHH